METLALLHIFLIKEQTVCLLNDESVCEREVWGGYD